MQLDETKLSSMESVTSPLICITHELPRTKSNLMPEGHTIHRIARDHRRWFAGQLIGLCSPQGRFEKESERLDGNLLQVVTAHGKHLFYHWSPQEIVHVHLGLYGKFRVHRNPAPEPRGEVRLRMIGQERSFDLNGPTCCELINDKQFRAIKGRLGQDPLSEDACPEKLWERICRSRSPIGTVLLNQSVIAGVGNVYRAEILFLLGIHPETPANELSREQFDSLWKVTSAVLRLLIQESTSHQTLASNSRIRKIETRSSPQRIVGSFESAAKERHGVYPQYRPVDHRAGYFERLAIAFQ
jgi:endonuclease VIII